jgi:hypothetical protein
MATFNDGGKHQGTPVRAGVQTAFNLCILPNLSAVFSACYLGDFAQVIEKSAIFLNQKPAQVLLTG